MAHEKDFWEPVRAIVVPKLGAAAQILEDITGQAFYTESETHNNQFVGRVPMDEESFEQVLHDLGFERNPIASYKWLEGLRTARESGSFRKVGFSGHPSMQLHVVLYNGSAIDSAKDDHTYVYAHWEKRWDTHPWQHYFGHGSYSGPEGVRRMKKLLDEEGVHYEPIRP